MVTFKVGDVVTWVGKEGPGSRLDPLGIAGCKVLALGQTRDGRSAARLKVGDHECGAYTDDLGKQD